jgi:competence protein ComEC
VRKFRRTTLITAGCTAVLAGLGLSRKLQITPQIWWLIFTPLFLLLKSKNFTSLIVICLLGLGLGMWRGGIYMQRLHVLQDYSLQKVTIQATATSDSVYSTKSQIQFTANNVQLIAPKNQPLAGSFKLSGFGEHMIYRGDRVQVTGKLYPTRGANQATIAYAQLTRIGIGHSWLISVGRRFAAGMQNALPEPVASFAMGLLVGQRVTLPQDVLAALTMVGLVHIVAVSGYNVTIIARAIARLRLPSKYQQLMLSLTFIAGFVLITGFSASIVRAAIVSLLTLWAWFYGRRIKPLVLIGFTAALTGMISPFYVWGDLGWYLSFLAFFGVLVIAPIISARLFSRPPKILTSVLIETFSAQIMTQPLIMMTFGQLSLVALIANLLIVPLVSVAMLLSAIAAAAGSLAAPVAGWFALPARLLLTYMLDVVHILASIPSEFLHLTIAPALMVACYGLVLLAVLAAQRHVHLKNAIITPHQKLDSAE